MKLLGRDDEVRSLHAFLDHDETGSMAALLLEGEAGIGKSTVWSAGVAAARERGFRVLDARPAEVEVGVSYAALGDLLEHALGDVLPELAEPRRRALETALLLGDGSGEPVEMRTLAVGVWNALHLLAAREPILVAIDDVQWLDASSASTLGFALRRLPEERIRLLLARRLGTGIAPTEVELAVDDRLLTRVTVGPLSPGALHAILQERLGRVLARPTLLRIHEAAGGNPFFALELARASGDDVDPTQPLPVPETLEVLVQARLDGLPAETRTALLLACAHGRMPSGHLDADALEPAYAAHVIELSGGVIRFTHPLLASGVYGGASPEARRRAHEDLAELVDDPVGRARHQALASDRPDAMVAATLEQAATVASARGAPMVAAELGEHALRATPADTHEDRHRLALATARAHLASGEGARPRAIALELLADAPAGTARAEALLLLAELERAQAATALLEEALDNAAANAPLRAALHRRVGMLGRLTKGMKWAEGHARAAVQIADELDDDALRAEALSALAFLRFNGGDPDAPPDAERAYELASRCGDAGQVDRTGFVLAHVLGWSVQTERARTFLESRYRERREHDERIGAGLLWHLALVELRAGRWVRAEQHAESSYATSVQYANPAPHDVFPLALVVAHRGDLERARELAEYGRDLADREGAHLGGLVSVVGLVEHWSGNPAEAERRFAMGEEAADAAGWREPNLRSWRADYAETLLALGRTDDAVALLDDWEAAAVRVGRDWVLAQVTRCRGLVAAARGDIDEAVRVLEAAVAHHEAVADPFGRARALLALGVVRRRARQKRPAREAIEAALAGFEELGAATWTEKARDELGKIGGRARVEDLTAAEQRVAVLVAEGKTNREVAAMLFLGERTVASHLTHIYAKLGVRSRTELARKVQTF